MTSSATVQMLRPPAAMPPDDAAGRQRLVMPDLVASYVGLTPRQVDRLVGAGLFPAPVEVMIPGEKRPARAWVEGEVQDWIRARMAERPGGRD